MFSGICVTLCAKICTGGVKPLEAKEWSAFCSLLNDKCVDPAALYGWEQGDFIKNLGVPADYAARLFSLVSREPEIRGKIIEYARLGIRAVTCEDGDFSSKLKHMLGATCPPVLFCAGDTALFKEKLAGYVGSREANKDDLAFARFCVKQTAQRGYGVVSGGARGVDSACEDEGLDLGCKVVEFPADGMIKRLKNSKTDRAVKSGQMLMASLAPPEGGFNLGFALMRNRYIYVCSDGKVVIRSDFNKGGTWSGATDCLKHGWCKLLCRRRAAYEGNTALIARGAVPVDISFNGDISAATGPENPEQLTLFK